MSYRTCALHHGSLFAVHDVHCSAPASGCGAEEHASSHHLVFVRSGVFVKHVGRRQIIADPSRVLFFNRDEPYRVSHPVDGGDACTMITCSPQAWAELLAPHDPSAADRPNAPFSTSHGLLPMRSIAAYHGLRGAIRRGMLDPIETEERALAVVDGVFSATYPARARPIARRCSTQAARMALAERVTTHLSSRPGERHSLAAVARAVDSSPFHLARVFREETGTSIHQYLLKLRLSLALGRVLDRPDSLSDIAASLGFSSHAHFTTLFRRAFGAVPSALRDAT